MIKAVVFDLDDTLYPEASYVMSGFKAVDRYFCEELGVPGFYRHAQHLFQKGHRGRIFNEVLDRLNFEYDEALIKRLIAVYRSHVPSITLSPDTVNILDWLSGQYKLGLITDGYQEAQRNKIKALGISEYFQAICVTDELGRAFWKPHSKPYILVQDGLGVKPEQCVYIADNPNKDFVTPKKMGWMTVRLSSDSGEYSHAAVQPDFQAEFIIHSLSELKHILPM
ncbi:HAD family hydrolase [Endozoicomonas lisbonensis]|uniref:Hydrolase of the HAD superfamily n=1 Tax=Endozoicomonas lisbonensis TaxID=3120522 RepID=A0ABV2SBF8_9GAMM